MNVRFSSGKLKVLGSGSALPGELVHNDQLLDALRLHCGERIARLAGKLVNKLGIQSRHVSRDLGQSISGAMAGCDAPELCRQALQQALKQRSDANRLCYLIGHTATPHTLLPPNISWVADAIRHSGPYVELRQACTGFANALVFSAAMIAEDNQGQIAIVGSETGSPFFDISADFTDREQLINFVQMGDGAGAVVLGANDGSDSNIISDIYFGHSGMDMEPGICISGGGSAQPVSKHGLPYFEHSASNVRKHGEQLLLNGINAIEKRGHKLEDFDWVLPHQASGFIAREFSRKFPACAGKVIVSADRLGNLGSAAIWVAFDELRRSGTLQKGQRVLVLGAEASKYMFGGFVYTH